MSKESINRKHWEMERSATGRQEESDLLEVIDGENETYQRMLREHGITPETFEHADFKKLPYVNFTDALEMARVAQPWEDPANPKTDFLKELRLAIASELGIENDEKALERLRLYTAVGSLLDIKHGKDAFVEYEKEKRIFRVFIDATADPKRKKPIADTVIVDTEKLGDPVSNEKKYLGEIAEVAKAIVRIFKTQETATDTN
ncbi:hypothetical protein KGQ34_02225 [Patescibacteria group bacterium]|nr:hypothetical protein [Patescibacteria group bacterium]